MHSPSQFGSADARSVSSFIGDASVESASDGHPSGLYVLSFVEMCERFGFSLLVALLALYLDEQLHRPREQISLTYGLFLGAAYLTPLGGGVLADRWLGCRWTVLLGASIVALGYLMLAGTSSLVAALAVLALGTGLFKSSISSMVGNLYGDADPRRDRGFAVFYMGINVGGLTAPFAGEWLRSRWGWSEAFAAAGGAMLLGLLVLVACWRRLAETEGWTPCGGQLPQDCRSPGGLTEAERARVRALLILASVVVFFWVAFQQSGCALTFWARTNIDRTVRWAWLARLLGRSEIPTVWFSALSSFFVVALSPVMVRLWGALRRREREPSTPAKMLIGMLLAAVAYGVLTIAAWLGGDMDRVSMSWLVCSYLILSIAELCLSPMGMSMVAKLAPRSLLAVMMGVWFLATFVGNSLAGVAGMLWPYWSHARFFLLLVGTSLISAALLWRYQRRLTAAMEPPSARRLSPQGPVEP